MTLGLRAGTCVERLENRTLLSATAGSPHVGFGNGGVLAGYEVLGSRDDGYLIASNAANKLALLHPDGTFASNYSGPRPLTVPQQNVQADGKYLLISNNILTRYNKNGTVDKTFGTNGSVSNFAVAESGHASATYYAERVVVDGNKIFVAGVENYAVDAEGDTANDFFVESLTAAGKIDTTFGNHGIAHPVPNSNFVSYATTFFLEVGPDHKLYLAADYDLDPLVIRFTEAGKFEGYAFEFGYATGETVAAIAFQHDGKILVLTKQSFGSGTLTRYNSDFSLDTSFGTKGIVDVAPINAGPYGISDNTPVALFVRPDGVIFASESYVVDSVSLNAPYSFAYNPGLRVNPSAITGHFYNDLNGNGKRDANEPALRYWAAYADTNNDGLWENGEPIAYADYNGYYKIDGLAAGTAIIREIRLNGWARTQPAGIYPLGFYKIALGANQLVGLRDFGNRFIG